MEGTQIRKTHAVARKNSGTRYRTHDLRTISENLQNFQNLENFKNFEISKKPLSQKKKTLCPKKKTFVPERKKTLSQKKRTLVNIYLFFSDRRAPVWYTDGYYSHGFDPRWSQIQNFQNLQNFQNIENVENIQIFEKIGI